MNDNNNENFGLDDIDEILSGNELEDVPEIDFANHVFEDVYSVSPDAPVALGDDEPVDEFENAVDFEPTMAFKPLMNDEPEMSYDSYGNSEAVMYNEPYQDSETILTDDTYEDSDPAPAPQPDEVFIVDETSTNMVIEDTPVPPQAAPPVAPPFAPMNYQASNVPVQSIQQTNRKPKKASSKIQGWQIAIIAVLGIITLWLGIFTTDHTLAANGLSPLFSKMTHEYEDGSQSFVGLGYKIQFQFDENGDLTQKCVPLWQKGPNDTKFANTNNNNE